MATGNLNKRVAQVRSDAADTALREALLVPWSRLQEAAENYVEWHAFVLWVRAITETATQVPEIVRSTLEGRCPGYGESQHLDQKPFNWQALQEWIAVHRFADARAVGWFNPLMYYAYKDLRTEQAWTLWQRSRAAWSHHPPAGWPTFEEWTADVDGTYALSQPGTGKARAVEALAKVEPDRLRSAVSDLLDSRAFALWVACVPRPQHRFDEFVSTELRRRCPDLVAASWPAAMSEATIISRLVRSGDAHWRAVARAQGWMPALRYYVVHHPRYHRLIHYKERCQDEWSQSRPSSYPSFPEWLAAADAYFVLRPA